MNDAVDKAIRLREILWEVLAVLLRFKAEERAENTAKLSSVSLCFSLFLRENELDHKPIYFICAISSPRDKKLTKETFKKILNSLLIIHKLT